MNMANELHGSFCAMHLQNYNICKKAPKKQLLKKYGCKSFWVVLFMFVFLYLVALLRELFRFSEAKSLISIRT
jgi:hypothetical protein